MEISKRLARINNDIMLTYTESKKKQSFEKKFENYTMCNQLISEANKILDEMQNQISRLDVDNLNVSHLEKINEYSDFLECNNPDFEQVLYITEQLISILNDLPNKCQIHDNIEQDVVQEF